MIEAMDDAAAAALEASLQTLEESLSDGDLQAANTELVRASEMFGEDQPDLLYYAGVIAWEESDFVRARKQFARAVEQDPRFGDAHHALGLLLEIEGDVAGGREHFMHVWKLDSEADQQEGRVGEAAELRIAQRAEHVVSSIPAEFRERLENVPIVIEERPHRDLVESGFDPRALGLFEGLEDGVEHDAIAVAPSRIVLYSANLVAAFPDPSELDEQIEITLLHEIGHFFGLDEEQVEDLGLG